MKNKLLVLFLLIIFSACEKKEIIAQIPDQPGFCLGDVLAITGGSCLSDAFTNSNAAYFDATYGSKDMNPQLLGGFRNYGICLSVAAPVATAASEIELINNALYFTMNWNAVDGAVAYWIEVDHNADFNDPHPAGGVGNVISYYTSHPWFQGDIIYYHIKAYNGCGNESAYSNTISINSP